MERSNQEVNIFYSYVLSPPPNSQKPDEHYTNCELINAAIYAILVDKHTYI